jgi:acetyl-CoA C-acetyltransferase
MTQGEQAYNIGRIMVLLSEKLPDTVTGSTIARYCASSLNSIWIAANAIKAGDGDTYIAAGVESVSVAGPHSEATLPDTRNPKLLGNDGTHDAYIAMGETAENVAERYSVKREDMDEFAARSQNLAVEARDNGFFDREIVPVETPDGVVDKDDGPRPGTTVEKLGELKPAFREGGSVTAGNSSPLNDGACCVTLASEATAAELGAEPLARVVSIGVAGVDPAYMGIGPIPATRMALERAGLTIDDIDLVELNEAFAAQVLACARELGIAHERLNVNGGAIALGHPLGCSGARLVTTLVHELRRRGGRYGLATMCIGVGQGMAMVVENPAATA